MPAIEANSSGCHCEMNLAAMALEETTLVFVVLS